MFDFIGLGGDMFSLYYDAKDQQVKCVNGSGRCPGKLNLKLIQELFPKDVSTPTTKEVNATERFGSVMMGNIKITEQDLESVGKKVDIDAHRKSVHAITVPGAARGWEEFYNRHASGKFTFAELLEPAAQLAENGFPVAPMTAVSWNKGVENDVKKWHGDEEYIPMTTDGKNGPKPGDIFKNPDMARVLRCLGEFGATKGFYEGVAGKAIVDAVQSHGGLMTMEDMIEEHTQCTFPESISVEYKGLKVHQIPPNGQGIAGLIALSGLKALEDGNHIPAPKCNATGTGWESEQTMHAMIEMMRLGFADARKFVCDQEFCNTNDVIKDPELKEKIRSKSLLNQERIAERAIKVFDESKAAVQGLPDPTSCTVSFQVVDKDGNAVSFVNSNFMGFGTGLVPKGCGFTLQNRGAGFSFEESHPNVIEPYKRPYHTIIPAMITHADTNELYATISNMGGFMQPQGHMQLTVALASGMDPQTAIDLPRFCIADGTHNGVVMIEDGLDEEFLNNLKEQGHNMISNVDGFGKSIFGKAQIIKRDRATGVLIAGSDGRSDGCALGF